MSENICISKKSIGRGVLLGLVLFAAWQYLFHRDDWRREFRSMMRSEAADLAVESFAGCQIRTDLHNVSDQEFGEIWKESTSLYHFDYYDVREIMEQKCPVESDPEIEKHERSSGQETIKKVKAIRDYQVRFLNRQYTALREDFANGR
jgi:hypothetical protein